ncbi:ABC transporter ATP-binding protein/permease [Actinoallomurus purpureus]|uniref:ABC transporter ATP-binding protein n=1 Tax=Actinoallomurus purpureus TaxID=478114 RepID=UPI002092BFC3|nr:ABC transporter ATP-binding protein [Actinoallomurus purpureus]MCO6007796.1 ABC transporter ATP-binding protein/permease [Actinoallomurus purpureus]
MRRRARVRELAVAAAEATALTWRSAPGGVSGYLLITLAEAATPIATAWLTKTVVDRLTTSQGPVAGPAAALVATGLAAAALPGIGRYLRDQTGRVAGVRATDRLFAATERQVGLRRFEDPVFLDRLRLAQEATASAGYLVDAVCGTARGALSLIGFLTSLLVISPLMTALVLLAAAPALIAELLLSRSRAAMQWATEQTHRREFFYSRLLTDVEAATEIRLFGIGAFLRARMMAERERGNAAERRMDRRELAVQGGLTALSAAVAGGGLWWAITAARHGTLGVGDVTMFLAAVGGVQTALDTLTASIATAHGRLLVFTHYVAVTRAEPDLPSVATGNAPELRRGVEFRDVWFRYSDDHPWVLRGVDLTIPHGRAVALVGLNGAGKSTLVKLLCRMYDPTHGRILWDGVDLRDIPPPALRERISAVFQDHMNYDMTARENIAVGDIRTLDRPEAIRRAAARAGVHDRLAGLPHGYDTLLTRMFFSEADKEDPETGVVLSGGQWQRLALARAFVRDGRDLMILDEPSSGLDPVAEHEVHAQMRLYRAGRTSLLISHRLSAVREADLIAILDGGRVVELGTHETLMAAGGHYARLFRLQAAGYREAPHPSEHIG